jgi:hypothetical protein
VNPTLLKAMAGFVPTALLVVGSALVFLRRRDVWSCTQLVGSACLVIVVVTHVCEALGWFPSMGWGLRHSVGHYVDLCCAVLGITLFPAGYFRTRELR